MSKIKYTNVTPVRIRVNIGSTYTLPSTTKAILLAVYCDPAPFWQPPTHGDRWGWRDDLDRRCGQLRVYTKRDNEDLPIAEVSILALMDASWRLLQTDDVTDLKAAKRTLNYIVERIEAEQAVGKATEALQGALEGSVMAYEAYVGKVCRGAGSIEPKSAVEAGGTISFQQWNPGLLGGKPKRVDRDKELQIECYMLRQEEIEYDEAIL